MDNFDSFLWVDPNRSQQHSSLTLVYRKRHDHYNQSRACSGGRVQASHCTLDFWVRSDRARLPLLQSTSCRWRVSPSFVSKAKGVLGVGNTGAATIVYSFRGLQHYQPPPWPSVSSSPKASPPLSFPPLFQRITIFYS
jgi:hypothetical protein